MEGRYIRLGEIIVTSGAAAAVPLEVIRCSLLRHRWCDWGDICPADKKANRAALRHGGRLLSAYHDGETTFWILTEADHSVTTVLLPDEY